MQMVKMHNKRLALVSDGLAPHVLELLRQSFEVHAAPFPRLHRRVDAVFTTADGISDPKVVNTFKREYPHAPLVIVGAAAEGLNPEVLCTLSTTAFPAELKALNLLLDQNDANHRGRIRLSAFNWSLPALLLLASLVIWQIVTQL